MSELFQKLKLPIIILAVLVAGYILYGSFTKKPAQTAILAAGNKSVASTTPDKDFLPLLLQIQGVSLDQKIFIDPVFRALVDWSQQIVPESVGKQNPFSGVLGAAAKSSVESLGFTESGTKKTTGTR
jgi:hypothetical protein